MQTHYDNLRISENAPLEVIRAAYKALSLRHHPDQNGNSSESHRIMQILNSAYAILSDTEKRRQYDERLAAIRATQRLKDEQHKDPKPTPQNLVTTPKKGFFHFLVKILLFDLRLTFCLGFLIWMWGDSFFREQKPKTTYQQTYPSSEINSPAKLAQDRFDWGKILNEGYPPPTRPKKPPYLRPKTNPYGFPWPMTASYIEGVEQGGYGGLSSVTIDNSKNTSDVHLKLVSIGTTAHPVRHCFIPAQAKFTFKSIIKGKFDVRYRDLSDGTLSKTEEFTLQENPTSTGTEYSNITLTLYKVINGNMQTETINESEF